MVFSSVSPACADHSPPEWKGGVSDTIKGESDLDRILGIRDDGPEKWDDSDIFALENVCSEPLFIARIKPGAHQNL